MKSAVELLHDMPVLGPIIMEMAQKFGACYEAIHNSLKQEELVDEYANFKLKK